MKPARKHNRLPGFDYRNEQVYFVTSCVKDMACVFGEVVAKEMVLNDFGRVAEKQWQIVMEKYGYVYSHAFVVMPNHVHGLVEINLQWDSGSIDQEIVNQERADQECVGTGRDLSVRDLVKPKIKSISGIMGAYKMTTSKLIRQTGLPEFT